MGKIEITHRHGLKKALGDELAFPRLQRRGVPDGKPVAENRCSRADGSSYGRSFRRDGAGPLSLDLLDRLPGTPLRALPLAFGRCYGAQRRARASGSPSEYGPA